MSKKGGLSFLPYGPGFTDRLKRQIKERDGCKCAICGEEIKALSIHHVDYDKQNNDPYNLITLCFVCHGRTNADRAMWQSALGWHVGNLQYGYAVNSSPMHECLLQFGR